MWYQAASALGSLALAVAPTLGAAQELASDAEVALIGSAPIAYGQLPASVRTDLAASERRYQRQLAQMAIEHRRERRAIVQADVANYIDQQLLETEARSRDIPVERLASEIADPSVSRAEVRAFYEQHRQEMKEPLEAVSAAIAQHLKTTRSAHQREALREKYGAHLTLEPLREAVPPIGPARGPRDAAVTIVEFADFQCPYCRQLAPLLRELLERYPRELRLVYRQLPLTELHADALTAARASVCAHEQGRFWDMHDALLADADALNLDGVKQSAARLNLNAPAFAACLDAPRTAAAIDRDTQAAEQFGVAGTPGLFVNGRFVGGATSYDQLLGLIEDELRRQARAPASVPAHTALSRW